MPSPIPLHYPRNNSMMAASGFMVRVGKRYWLLTCAHTVTGVAKTPVNALHLFNGELVVVGSTVRIPLMRNQQKRFIALEIASSGELLDLISVPLDAVEAMTLSAYGSYDGDTIVRPAAGMHVVMEGFPGMEFVAIPVRQANGIIQLVQGNSIKLSVPSEVGFSGGPVLSDGRLVGVTYGDIGFDGNLTNALAYNLSTLSHALFV
jgi:hypothetical protein